VEEFLSRLHLWYRRSTPLKGGVLILVGSLVIIIAILLLVVRLNSEVSPFDQLDSKEQGFIPLVDIAEEEEGAPDLPTPQVSAALIPDPDADRPASDTMEALETEEQFTDIQQTPKPEPIYIPDRVVIPAIELDAPVVAAGIREIDYWGKIYEQWMAPDEFAAGWHTTSATPGLPGNTVLNGHHNVYGEVFKRLEDLEVGDQIKVFSGDQVFLYQIATKLILEERWQPVEVRLENARWLQHSNDERLTLVTCWPYESNTHRLILAAIPVRSYTLEGQELEQLISPDLPE
jgi:LPXTG-site transpeptidase (sortase) family protein